MKAKDLGSVQKSSFLRRESLPYGERASYNPSGLQAAIEGQEFTVSGRTGFLIFPVDYYLGFGAFLSWGMNLYICIRIRDNGLLVCIIWCYWIYGTSYKE